MFVIPLWIDFSVPVIVYLFALAMGSTPERIVGGLCGLSWFYTVVIDFYWLGQRLAFQLGRDLFFLVVITVLSLRFDRWWLLVAAMTMLLKVATDAAVMIVPVDRWAFGTTMWTWGWIFIAALATGTWRSWRLRRRGRSHRRRVQVRQIT